jgi:hypothetical protein
MSKKAITNEPLNVSQTECNGMDETIAAQIQTVLRTKGSSPSAQIYIKSNYGAIAHLINQLTDSHVLDASELVITCALDDLERIKTVMGMIPNVRLLSTSNYAQSQVLLYGSTQA